MMEFMGPPTELATTHSTLSVLVDFYVAVANILSIVFPIVSALVLLYLLGRALIFNYHHFVHYGEFCLLPTDLDKVTNRRIRTENKTGISHDLSTYVPLLFFGILGVGLSAILGLVWGVVVFFSPFALIYIFAYRKRRRRALKNKLAGVE